MTDWLTAHDIGNYYVQYYERYLSGLLAGIVVMVLLRRRLPRLVRVAAWVVIGVCSARLILFDNPMALRLYQHALTSQTLGMRQWGVLELEIWKYRRKIDQPRLRNLAVGSSQVAAIFYNWVSQPAQPLNVYTLAGMKPLDFVLNENAILAQNPARVILYISSFDMSWDPELFSLPLAPPQPSAMWSTYRLLRASGLPAEDLAASLHEYVFSQLLPEYRYSFVFRAFLRRWFGGAPRPEETPEGFVQFVDHFNPRWLNYHFTFLRAFLGFCQAHGIEVVIAEGRINPDSRTPEINALDATVRERLLALLPQYPGVRYVPAADVYEFKAGDYRDMVHVFDEPARRYAARFAALLSK